MLENAIEASGMAIEKSIWPNPAQWLDWKDEVATPPEQVVFFYMLGHEVSPGLNAAYVVSTCRHLDHRTTLNCSFRSDKLGLNKRKPGSTCAL